MAGLPRGADVKNEMPNLVERRSICFPHHGTQDVLQPGHEAFQTELQRLYSTAENNALEEVIELKKSLRPLPNAQFWDAVTEGISKILGAQIAFVMKRVLVDDQESAVEMPPIGTPGSCIMAAALHYCDNDGTRTTYNGTKYAAYGCPCAYMRHDKVFLIPERLGDFITNNPNQLPTPCDAYIAVPLFEDNICFAHFGVMWSTEGAARRTMSWAFIEMIMHSLEDQISQRFLEGSGFVKAAAEKPKKKIGVIPHDAVTVAQSLRPYAGSLSHELRTPMQGIVGMLDVMYATVQEAMESQADPRVRKVFQQLKDNIETVQDSSRRAVEAADNVVHAYDMDMSVPEAPTLLEETSDMSNNSVSSADKRPEILVAGSNLPISRPNKRRRDDLDSRNGGDGGPVKVARLAKKVSACRCVAPVPDSERKPLEGEDEITDSRTFDDENYDAPDGFLDGSQRIIAPGLRHTSLRELIQLVINDGLKLGGRPDSAVAQETDLGEIIEVRTRGSDGTIGQKTIEWCIEPGVPSTLFIDEKDLSKLISCVFLNAIKFTNGIDGKISVRARMSSRGRYIVIAVADNGPGIPSAFLPKLFKAFSQENGSLTRSSEGLGLGLMVAKGIARKLGGDLTCTRAETTGSNHGTEFEIKVPIQAGETISRPSSPFGSPLPRKAQPVSDAPHFKPLPAAPTSPRSFGRALHDVVSEGSYFHKPTTHEISLPTSPRTLGANEISPPSSLPSPPSETVRPVLARPRVKKSVSNPEIDRDLANKYPLTFLVAEDNKINRKLLVSMLNKFGYKTIIEAHDGAEAVRQMSVPRKAKDQVDVVLMDLWMPLMDGYEATERILGTNGFDPQTSGKRPTVLAVTADVTDGALERAAEVGMKGFMTKPFKLHDLQRLITEYCAAHKSVGVA